MFGNTSNDDVDGCDNQNDGHDHFKEFSSPFDCEAMEDSEERDVVDERKPAAVLDLSKIRKVTCCDDVISTIEPSTTVKSFPRQTEAQSHASRKEIMTTPTGTVVEASTKHNDNKSNNDDGRSLSRARVQAILKESILRTMRHQQVSTPKQDIVVEIDDL
jgi:hypothetical protein